MSQDTLFSECRKADKRLVWALLVGLGVFACIIACRELTTGGFSWSDAPLHAMDGVFLHDLARERPSGSLQAWAEQYYLRHQCLGIGVYYPPLFAAVEAVVFLVAGISVAAARLTVVFFVVGAVWLIFLLGRELFGTLAGLIGAAVALITPAGVAWSRQVMLEWPATFWIILALLAYVRLCRSPRWRWGALMAAGCVGAYLTKQTAAFVLPVILLHSLLRREWQLLRRPAFYMPLMVGLGMILAYATATAGMNALAPQLIAGTPRWHHLITLDHWTWYLLRTPSILGWPIMVALAVASIGVLADVAVRRQALLPVLWAVGWWLISTIIAAKEERYLFFAVPAVALLVGAGLQQLYSRAPDSWRSFFPAAVCSLALLFAGISAVTTPAMRLPHMKPTVEHLAGLADADLVLVDAVRDGQFIFDVRRLQPRGRRSADAGIIPLRASKLLYSRAARTRYAYQQHVETTDEIVELLDRLGIHYLVLENRLPTAGQPGEPPVDEDRSWDTPPRFMLRELVEDSTRFERVFTQPMKGGDPVWDDVSLVTYRYKDAPARSTDGVRIPIPAMGRDVELRMEENR
jgi:4-amino-4-deoxy-L-arabinose transferase-like glycosyltransferase